MQLIVLGMHRSGTSVMARLLNLMGAYFGPEGMSTGANQENPKGFWERRDVRALNDAVLHGVGCDWDRVLDLDVHNLPQEIVSEFDAKASKLLLEMDAHRPWLLKEPRLCLLIELWRKWLEVPICIHILRHPVEVASSLRTRNQIPIEAGLELWQRYVWSAFKGSEGLPALTLFHRDLMHDPSTFTQRLFEKLSALGVAGLRQPRDAEVHAFVKSDLHRERETRADLKRYLDRPEVAAYAHMLEQGDWPAGWRDNVQGEMNALAVYEAMAPMKEESRKARVAAEGLEKDLRAARSEIQESKRVQAEKQKTADEVRRVLEQQRAAYADTQARAQQKEQELRRAVAQGQEGLRQAAEKAEELKKATARVNALEREKADLLEMRQQLEESRRSAQREVEVARRDAARLTRKLIATDQDNSTLRQRREETAEALHEQRKRSSADIAALRSDLTAALEAGEAHRSDLEKLRAHWTWRIGAPVRVAFGALRNLMSRTPVSDAELVRSSNLFESNWYLTRYPDVAADGADPVEHFIAFGGNEERDPGPNFSTSSYLKANADVKEAGMNALVHYLRHGRAEKRRLV